MTLMIVRHGRTNHNASGLLLGRLDPELDALGERQAAAVASTLAVAGVDRVVSSPLRRARQTAEAIAVAAGVDVEVDDQWIEIDYGVLDGTPLADVPAELWARWRADPSYAPEGGESLAAVAARVATACTALADDAGQRNVVVVSHVSPVKASVCWALGVEPDVSWRTFVAPGSVTRIGIGPGGPVLQSFNELPGPG
jgi:broad specificity phosphatase PhoE